MMPGSDKRIYDFPATGPSLVPTKKSSGPYLLCRRVRVGQVVWVKSFGGRESPIRWVVDPLAKQISSMFS